MGSNHATSLTNKYSHHHLQDLNVSSIMWHIKNVDYHSNSPCESSVQLNISRKGVWPINSRGSLVSLSLAKGKFGKGRFEGPRQDQHCTCGGLFTPLLQVRQPNSSLKYFCCSFRLFFLLQSMTNKEYRLSLFQLSQLFHSFQGLRFRSFPLQLLLDNLSSSNLPSQFRVSEPHESTQWSTPSSKHMIYHILGRSLKLSLASYIVVSSPVT